MELLNSWVSPSLAQSSTSNQLDWTVAFKVENFCSQISHRSKVMLRFGHLTIHLLETLWYLTFDDIFHKKLFSSLNSNLISFDFCVQKRKSKNSKNHWWKQITWDAAKGAILISSNKYWLKNFLKIFREIYKSEHNVLGENKLKILLMNDLIVDWIYG